eukprot:scaffold259_cov252-Pinguiococcus_pyrenoidosus.AAC.28
MFHHLKPHAQCTSAHCGIAFRARISIAPSDALGSVCAAESPLSKAHEAARYCVEELKSSAHQRLRWRHPGDVLPKNAFYFTW